MTLALWYDNPALTSWEATVAAADGRVITLDRTAFFPGGGGQPADEGTVSWDGHSAVVTPGPGLSLTLLEGDPTPPPGTTVRCHVDDERRRLVMRTHTAMHLLTAVMSREFHAHVTGCDMGPGFGRMDFDIESVPPTLRQDLQEWLNTEVRADHQISIEYIDPAEFDPATMVRAEESLVPEGLDRIRLVRIGDIDLQADGGTHVSSTAQVGGISVTKIENKGRGHRRIRIELQEVALP